MISISSRGRIRSTTALLLLLMLLSTAEANSYTLHRRSIRGIIDLGDDSSSIHFRGNQRKLQANENEERIRKAKEPSRKTDVPIEPTRAPGLVYNVDEEGANTNSMVCRGVTTQEPPSITPDEYSIRNFAMIVDVLYGQSTSVSSMNIESLLNDQNIAMALTIAGCEDKTEKSNNIEKTDGKRRTLQEEIGMPSIIYSEVGTWKTKGPCVENTIAVNSLQPWKDLCQREFLSIVQLRAKQSTTSQDLIDQVTQAFDATSKLAVQTNEAVYAVAIREIYQESEIIPETDSNQGPVRRRRMPVRNIMMYTLGAACIFVSIVIFIQLGLYEKRKKEAIDFYLDAMSHIVFEEEEPNSDEDSDVDSVDSAIDLMLVASNKARGSSSSDELENSQRCDEQNVTEIPTYASLDFGVPFDEQDPGRMQNFGRSQSYVTVMNTRITVVEDAHDFEKRHRSLDAVASKRNYSLEEC